MTLFKSTVFLITLFWASLSYGENTNSLAEIHYTLGNLHSDEENLDKAIVEYKKALELNPDFARAENDLGFVLYKKGDYKDALVHYQRAISLRPDYANCYNNIGVIHYHLKDYEQASSFYRQAIELRPDYARAHFNLAACCFRQGRYLTALQEYRKARKIDRRYVEERADQKRLETELKKAQKNDPDNDELKKVRAFVQKKI